MTEHRNAVHFVHAFNEVCTTTPRTASFRASRSADGSVEEIWMAFSNGAVLVLGTSDTPKFGNDLARYLGQQRVTYFSTVPTMLSTMTETVPTLRQLVVSGEVCPPELGARWATPGRVMLNVYGPTEATVNTTAAVCRPGHPITIGRPLAGYETFILDADMRPSRAGTTGELYVGGPGVSRGYLKRPDLTERAFVVSPHDGRRLYRTGDLARIDARGEIEYFGRVDSQVKIRGYRVELAEIETVLFAQPHVASAVVQLNAAEAAPCLAAYVVLEPPGAPFDRTAALAAVRARLPDYMVPAFLDVVDALPMLPSGKVDRKRLPAPISPLIDAASAGTPPATPLEAAIAEVWAEIFRVPQISVEQDFFLDLGGHSLVAAQMTALVRSRTDRNIAVRDIAVRDVYAYPTVRKLAAYLGQPSGAPHAGSATQGATAAAFAPHEPSPTTMRLQVFVILAFFVLASVPLIVVVPFIDDLLRDRMSPLALIAILLPALPALWLLLLAVSIGGKWIVVGRYRPGAYPLWGSYYIRWWIAARLQGLSGAAAFAGTPLMSVYYRLMGATVGRHCTLDTALCSIFDLVTVGDDTSIGADTQLLGCRIENGHLLIGHTDIGSRCFIGAHSALGLDVHMGDDARLDDQSLLPDGAGIPAGEQRRGAPAQAAEVPVPGGRPRRAGIAQQGTFVVLALVIGFLLGILSALPTIGMLALWLNAFQNDWLAAMILLTVVATPLFVVVNCLWIAMLKALLLHRAAPGIYPLYSWYYLRHWLAYGLLRASRALMLPLFTTLYLPPWMRLLGARIGPHAEMSTVFCFTPSCSRPARQLLRRWLLPGRPAQLRRALCARAQSRRQAQLCRQQRNPAAGSGARRQLPAGVLSVPPRSGRDPDGIDWLGSPAFRLPTARRWAASTSAPPLADPQALSAARWSMHAAS